MLLVYPGGGQEELKYGWVPKYSRMWKERLGLARMVINHAYFIVPCSSVGVGDMLDIVADIDVSCIREELYFSIVSLICPRRLQKVHY
jgi:hypothetical protein